MGMILRIASSRIVGQGDIVGRSGYFSLNLSANSVMRGRLDARRTLKSLVADLRSNSYDSKKGTCKVQFLKIYKPQGIVSKLKLITETLDVTEFIGYMEGSIDFSNY